MSDDGRGAAARKDDHGGGIEGMRQRATVFGGTLTAGPKAGGGFLLRARLPLPRRDDVGAGTTLGLGTMPGLQRARLGTPRQRTTTRPRHARDRTPSEPARRDPGILAPMTIRVALVDDQQLIRAGFRMVVASQPDMDVVVEAGTGDEAVTALAALDAPVDVVLMDVRMPGRDGIDACAEITSASEARVIILTTFDLDEYVVRRDQGRRLRVPPQGRATRGPASRDPHGARGRRRHRAHDHAPPAHAPGDGTPRAPRGTWAWTTSPIASARCLLLMARGLSNQEICAELVVAEATVKTHVGKVLAKLGARDRVQAVVIAYETGLVRPSA